MNLRELINEETDDGGYDDSGNMFAVETITELNWVSFALME